VGKVREGSIALTDIVIDESYLSRVKPHTETIQEYVEALMNGADLSKREAVILEDGTNKLLSGYHRTRAYLRYADLLRDRNGNTPPGETLDLWPEVAPDLSCEFHAIPSGMSPALYAYTFNNEHGLRQSGADARKVCREQYEQFPGTSFKLLMACTKLSEPTIRKYLGDLLHEFDVKRNAGIERLRLLGWTQDEIVGTLKRIWPEGATTQQRIAQILQENEKVLLSCKMEFAKNVPIASLAKKYEMDALATWAYVLDGTTDQERFASLDIAIQPYDVLHFTSSDDRFGTDAYPGRIPGQLVAHVLHWFTNPGDTVLDPMAGGGTIPDVCLAMGRKCYAYDVNGSQRIDILPHNLAVDGWPERLKKADLIFWDPPYFDKKDDGYPEGSISRLSRDAYCAFFAKAFADAKAQAKKGTRLALLMSDWNDAPDATPRRDGIFVWDYADLLRGAGWTITEHIQVPLSTQQVHPDIVNKFRAAGRRARLERYLLIAKV
jgi:DNA methylase